MNVKHLFRERIFHRSTTHLGISHQFRNVSPNTSYQIKTIYPIMSHQSKSLLSNSHQFRSISPTTSYTKSRQYILACPTNQNPYSIFPINKGTFPGPTFKKISHNVHIFTIIEDCFSKRFPHQLRTVLTKCTNQNHFASQSGTTSKTMKMLNFFKTCRVFVLALI